MAFVLWTSIYVFPGLPSCLSSLGSRVSWPSCASSLLGLLSLGSRFAWAQRWIFLLERPSFNSLNTLLKRRERGGRRLRSRTAQHPVSYLNKLIFFVQKYSIWSVSSRNIHILVYCAKILVRYCYMLHGHHDLLFGFDQCLWNASLSHGIWGKTMNYMQN